jgi:hypothetical protein
MKAIESDIKLQLSRLCSIVDTMLALSGMMRASFGTTYRRCGKPTCWCANPDEKGHPCTKLMWTDETGPKTRAVRNDDTHTVLNAIGQYREYKKLRRSFRTEANKLDNLLNVFERFTTVENRSKMGFSGPV